MEIELMDYSADYGKAGTLSPSFDELLAVHSMCVNQPMFEIEGCSEGRIQRFLHKYGLSISMLYCTKHINCTIYLLNLT